MSKTYITQNVNDNLVAIPTLQILALISFQRHISTVTRVHINIQGDSDTDNENGGTV